MSDFVGIDIQGIPRVRSVLNKVVPAVQDAVVDSVSKFLIDVLQEYPPPKRVTRKAAYGVAFFSDRQRRWFFWALRTNQISVPYRRTGDMRRGWRKIGNGATSILANETVAAVYSHDDVKQARLNRMVGWLKLRDIIKQREDRIGRVAEGAAKRAIRRITR